MPKLARAIWSRAMQQRTIAQPHVQLPPTAAPDPDAAQFYTTEQLAGKIIWHTESVRRAIRQGRIRALPFGRSWRIPAQEVSRILSEGIAGSN